MIETAIRGGTSFDAKVKKRDDKSRERVKVSKIDPDLERLIRDKILSASDLNAIEMIIQSEMQRLPDQLNKTGLDEIHSKMKKYKSDRLNELEKINISVGLDTKHHYFEAARDLVQFMAPGRHEFFSADTVKQLARLIHQENTAYTQYHREEKYTRTDAEVQTVNEATQMVHSWGEFMAVIKELKENSHDDFGNLLGYIHHLTPITRDTHKQIIQTVRGFGNIASSGDDNVQVYQNEFMKLCISYEDYIHTIDELAKQREILGSHPAITQQ